MQPHAPWWTWIAVAASIVLACITGWLAPAYKQTVKERDSYKSSWEEQHSETVTYQAELATLREQRQVKTVSGSVQEPVMLGGVLAYRKVSWMARSENDVRESVAEALKEARVDSFSASGAVTIEHTKDTTTVKRENVDVGLGWGTGGQVGVLLGARIIGPVGAWGMASAVIGGLDHLEAWAGTKLTF